MTHTHMHVCPLFSLALIAYRFSPTVKVIDAFCLSKQVLFIILTSKITKKSVVINH